MESMTQQFFPIQEMESTKNQKMYQQQSQQRVFQLEKVMLTHLMSTPILGKTINNSFADGEAEYSPFSVTKARTYLIEDIGTNFC